MAITPPKNDSRLGKGYSYFFAFALIFLMISQCIDFRYKTNNTGYPEVAIATRPIDLRIFYPSVFLIAAILGLPTDAIMLAFGRFLSSRKEQE